MNEQVSMIIRNTASYVEGVELGMGRAAVLKLFGRKPGRTMKSPDGVSEAAVWKLSGRSVSVEFDASGIVDGYCVHWIGLEDEIPSYEDILPPGFSEYTRKGTRIFETRSEKAAIRWTRAPVPGQSVVISLLSISRSK